MSNEDMTKKKIGQIFYISGKSIVSVGMFTSSIVMCKYSL